MKTKRKTSVLQTLQQINICLQVWMSPVGNVFLAPRVILYGHAISIVYCNQNALVAVLPSVVVTIAKKRLLAEI